LSDIHIIPVQNSRQRKQFVKFPWQIYKDDPNWVPPLIQTQLSRLNPKRSPFFKQGEAELFLATRNGKILGTIVPWINHRANSYRNELSAGFGFFEITNDYEIASALLQKACDWSRARGAKIIRGPLYFSPQDSPGVIVKGFDIPPMPMTGHSPKYYSQFLVKFVFEKHRDAFAYRVELTPFNNDLNNLPIKLIRVAQAVQKRYKVVIRTIDMKNWNNELKSAMFIFNEALGFQREGVPMEEAEFIKLASEFKKIVDPSMVFFAEVDRQPIGLYVALPNINEVLHKVNGRLFPMGWLKFLRSSKYITVASTKILGVLKEFRNKGIDALFYFKIAEELIGRGHKWIDYSLIAEENDMANRLVQRLGGKIYKICRTYKMNL